MTQTPSLRRRVTFAVLALLASVLLILGVAIDVTFGAQVRRDLHDRLVASATRADALVEAGAPPPDLAAQLNGGSIRALVITPDGQTYGDPAISPDTVTGPGTPLPPPPPPPRPGPADRPDRPGPPQPPPPPPDETNTVMVHPLPSGGRVILVADTTQSTAALRDLRELMIGAGAVTLVLAALLLIAVARGALRPLDRLTGVAKAITTGDRGRRLQPDRPHTELGRAAAAFDDMLDALEAAERQAQQAAEAARRAESQTRDFLADAAHELRTPLAGIQVAAEQLVNTSPDASPAARRRTQLLLADARRAGRLVNDMLDLSRIDAGLPLYVVDTDLARIADDQVQRADMLAPRATVTRTGVDHLEMRADPQRVGQILSNLLDNARRYTPPGGRITVHVEQSGSDARLTVTDTGPGIPAADRDRVFERLVRLDSARNRDHGGAGLGLAIARSLARAHGGDLTCDPQDTGARFTLTLPFGAMSTLAAC